MQVTASNNKVTLFSWNEQLLKEKLAEYKSNGYSLSYMRDELYHTKIGPFRTFTALLEFPVREINGLRLVVA